MSDGISDSDRPSPITGQASSRSPFMFVRPHDILHPQNTCHLIALTGKVCQSAFIPKSQSVAAGSQTHLHATAPEQVLALYGRHHQQQRSFPQRSCPSSPGLPHPRTWEGAAGLRHDKFAFCTVQSEETLLLLTFGRFILDCAEREFIVSETRRGFDAKSNRSVWPFPP
jgi:hypothetical protein